MSRRGMCLAAILLGATEPRAFGQAAAESDPWPSLAAQIFNDRLIGDGSKVLGIDAPYRAEDAAVVPIGLHDLMPAGDTRRLRRITFVIDQNPSPLAATFTLGENSGVRNISTRVRIDSYTNIHAVAETSDGVLLGADRFVKAAGGCSAPAAKQEADSIPLGTMRFRQFTAKETPGAAMRQAQLMIRHPNYTGMQMDQLTRLYVPAHFVSSVHIWQGDDLLLGIETGISISENPAFRFDFQPNGTTEFRAEVKDSEGKVFKESWPVARA
ncbi:MAG: quinoprotein dehydrogenase-associated SoxYZ-like carrier [Rhodospirillales bacterium 20-64-7]|nr:MAG: quinoprotein dehydrogenase-associated SoxYZ-like carrier [Rhodospirillales bacterium 20-64-7]